MSNEEAVEQFIECLVDYEGYTLAEAEAFIERMATCCLSDEEEAHFKGPLVNLRRRHDYPFPATKH